MRSIRVGERVIGEGQPCFIIAEAGVNHNGSITLARALVDAAKAAGADAVKFQTFRAENLVTRAAKKARYQEENTKSDGSQLEMLKSLELGEEAFRELAGYAARKGIVFLSTPFDLESVALLDRLGIAAYKVASGEITNYPLLKAIALTRKPVILSTGMATIEEVEMAVACLRNNGCCDLVLLHCTSNYPTRYEDCNLRAMATLRDRFSCLAGYSDHTRGICIPVAAAALGATVIEKHFTTDRKLPGPDHVASLEPAELKAMVTSIRAVEKALGSGVKKPAAAELDTRAVARKSIVAAADIPAGARLSEAMLGYKRPGTGIPPKDAGLVLGKIVKHGLKRDQMITLEDVE